MPTLRQRSAAPPHGTKCASIDLEKLPDEFRLQRLVFRAAQKAFDQLAGRFKGRREYLLFQLVRLVEQFIDSNNIDIPSLFHQDPLRKRILLSLKIDAVVQHLLERVNEQNTLKLEPVFDAERPIGIDARDAHLVHDARVRADAAIADQPHRGG